MFIVTLNECERNHVIVFQKLHCRYFRTPKFCTMYTIFIPNACVFIYAHVVVYYRNWCFTGKWIWRLYLCLFSAYTKQNIQNILHVQFSSFCLVFVLFLQNIAQKRPFTNEFAFILSQCMSVQLYIYRHGVIQYMCMPGWVCLYWMIVINCQKCLCVFFSLSLSAVIYLWKSWALII